MNDATAEIIVAQIAGVILVIAKYHFDLRKNMANTEAVSQEVIKRFDERADSIHDGLTELATIQGNQKEMFDSVNSKINDLHAELVAARPEPPKGGPS